MDKYRLTAEQIALYSQYLRAEERSPGTIEKYLRDIRDFTRWLGGTPVTKELAAGGKERLCDQGYAPATINSMLAALNGLFRFLGWGECRVRFLKIQRRLFRDTGRELTRPEYERLLTAAQGRGQERSEADLPGRNGMLHSSHPIAPPQACPISGLNRRNGTAS